MKLNVTSNVSKLSDTAIRADFKDSVQGAMVAFAVDQVTSGTISRDNALHVVAVAIKAMNIGTPAEAIHHAVNVSFDDLITERRVAATIEADALMGSDDLADKLQADSIADHIKQDADALRDIAVATVKAKRV